MIERRLAAIYSGVSSRGVGADEAGVAVLEAEAVEILLPAKHSSHAGTITVRRATVDDIPSLRMVTHYGFASNTSLSAVEEQELPEEMGDEQTWGAFEDGRAVAQLYAHDWTLGGGAAGCRIAAVSGVGTLPEFRRLGLLRTMMSILFNDMMEKGQHVACLHATQAAIYQRYGYSEAVRLKLP